ncbi:MAG: carboxylating nicotinate-nucleotide diphosphorylase [Armatimonadota bacterium]|jgi:nicotinate-nucleotide pyrophosphorylase (carboxylating)
MHARVLEQIVAAALDEDIGPGDVTTEACVGPELTARARIRANEAGAVAGLAPAQEAFRQLCPAVSFAAYFTDGDRVDAGTVIAEVGGKACGLLTAERTALNFLQRLSGIATLTSKFVAAVEGTQAAIVDTRKTTPGLRVLEKAAVRAGGGRNHRLALYDGVIIKDNHIRAAGGIAAAVAAARRGASHLLSIEVEVATLEQLDEALSAGADVVMLDNMAVPTLREAVQRVAGRAVVEASGGVTLGSVREIAAAGVDLVSVGALTHSAPALDISMDFVDDGETT